MPSRSTPIATALCPSSGSIRSSSSAIWRRPAKHLRTPEARSMSFSSSPETTADRGDAARQPASLAVRRVRGRPCGGAKGRPRRGSRRVRRPRAGGRPSRGLRPALESARRLGQEWPVGLVREDCAQRRGRVARGDDLDPVGIDERGMTCAARAGEREQLGPQRDEVVRGRADLTSGSRPRISQRFWVATPVGQLPVWQRWAWMQPIGQHRLAGDVDHVAAEREREQRGSGKPSLPAPMKTTSSAIPARAKTRVDARERELERQRDVVAERERRGAGAAFAAVDRDEVGAAAGGGHALGQLRPERRGRRPPT